MHPQARSPCCRGRKLPCGLSRALLLASVTRAGAFHATAAFFGVEFFAALRRVLDPEGLEPLRILEVGSLDVNGGLRSYAPRHWQYLGVDLAPGRGVDHVLHDPYHCPFDTGSFHAVVSTSTLEHVQLFWLAFLEMLRVTREDGYVFVIAPSNLVYHGDKVPPDSWRFLSDAASSLELWGRRSGYPSLEALQGFVHDPVPYQKHEDNVMIFARGPWRQDQDGAAPLDSRLASTTGARLQIPAVAPTALEVTLDRVAAQHRCWQSSSLLRHSRLGGVRSLGLTCCTLLETREPSYAPLMEELGCWRDNRSYGECCPYVMTD